MSRMSESKPEQLARLLEEGTPGPWGVGERRESGPGDREAGPWPTISVPLGAPIAILNERPGLDPARDRADAALIVEAVNALPALLECAEILKRIDTGMSIGDHEIAAALSALDEGAE